MKPNTQKFFERAILVLLIILSVNYIFVLFFNILPNLSRTFQYPIRRIIGPFIANNILQTTSVVFVILGIIQMIQTRKFEIFPIFKLPIMIHFLGTVIWIILFAFFPYNEMMGFSQNIISLQNVFLSLSFLLFISTIIYFVQKNYKIKFDNFQSVPKINRFIDLIVDSVVINLFFFSNYNSFQRVLDIDFMSAMPDSYYILFTYGVYIIYYFSLEILFLQTVGKLPNDSYVVYKGERFVAILFRTLSRLIPFDAISFFWKKGWHDSLSKTTVAKYDESAISEIEGIGAKVN